MLGLIGVAGAGLARESYQTLVFWWLDPWSAETPVLWTPTSGHVERLEAAASRLDDCVDPEEHVGVGADPRLGASGLHWFLWLAYSLPAYDLQPLGAVTEPDELDVLLLAGDREPEGWEVICRADPIRVYRRQGTVPSE